MAEPVDAAGAVGGAGRFRGRPGGGRPEVGGCPGVTETLGGAGFRQPAGLGREERGRWSLDPEPTRVAVVARSAVARQGLEVLIGELVGVEVLEQPHAPRPGDAPRRGDAPHPTDAPRPADAPADLAGALGDRGADLAVVEATPLDPPPPAEVDAPVLLLLDETPTDRALLRLFAGPVRGVALLDSPAEVLRGAVRALAAGQWFVDPRLVRSLVLLASLGSRDGPRPFGLTPQEQRLVALLPRGLSNVQLATELGISVETVKTHLRAVLEKLGAYDRAHAADLARRGGLA